jgi:hypothetical protein
MISHYKPLKYGAPEECQINILNRINRSYKPFQIRDIVTTPSYTDLVNPKDFRVLFRVSDTIGHCDAS